MNLVSLSRKRDAASCLDKAHTEWVLDERLPQMSIWNGLFSSYHASYRIAKDKNISWIS